MSTGPTVEVAKTYATVDITAGGATVTVDVPETTVSITAPGPQGPAGTGADGYILQAYDTTDQTAASVTDAYPVKLGSVDISDGITVANNGSGVPTRITFANDGDYNVQFSIQFQNASASEAHVNVWFRKNGVDIADSNSQATVPKKHGADDGSLILALNLIVNVGSSDYVEIVWQTESLDVSIQALPAGTTPTTPATPSVIVTAMVNRYLEVGPAGPGVAAGGTTGQVLTKASSTDYDTTWTSPGWVLLKTQNVGTNVSSVAVTNVFNTTYKVYQIIYIGGAGSTPLDIRMILGATTANYAYGIIYNVYGNPTVLSATSSSAPRWEYAGAANTAGAYVNATIGQPYETKASTISSSYVAFATNGAQGFFNGFLNNNTSYTDFTLTTNTGTLTGGTIRVYGLTS